MTESVLPAPLVVVEHGVSLKGGGFGRGGRRAVNGPRRIVCQTAPFGHFFLTFSESLFGQDFWS